MNLLVIFPVLSYKQEILYYCDDQKLVGYNMVQNQEVLRQNLPSIGNIIGVYAERSTY